MKTLIFNGSPRKKGDLSVLIEEFLRHLEGEYKIVEAYDCDIRPCIDCRYCWKQNGCSIKDGMQEVYDYIQDCDNILIASPIFFTELSGSLLAVASRLQTYFCAKYLRQEEPIKKKKKGGVLLVAGGQGPVDKAFSTAKVLLADMNATEEISLVYGLDTDHTPPPEDFATVEKAKQLALAFNKNQ